MTTYHTKEWHQWRENPKRARRRCILVSILLFTAIAALLSLAAMQAERVRLTELGVPEWVGILGGATAGVVLYLIAELWSVKSVVRMEPDLIEQRFPFWVRRLRWDKIERAAVQWKGDSPIVHLSHGGGRVLTIDTRRWQPPREIADAILLALGTHSVTGREGELWRPTAVRRWIVAIATVPVLAALFVSGAAFYLNRPLSTLIWVPLVFMCAGGIAVVTAVGAAHYRGAQRLWPVLSGTMNGVALSAGCAFWGGGIASLGLIGRVLLLAGVFAMVLGAVTIDIVPRWEARLRQKSP